MDAVHDVAILTGSISATVPYVHTLTYFTHEGPPVAILALGRSGSSPFQVRTPPHKIVLFDFQGSWD